jgi:hypothetical protein
MPVYFRKKGLLPVDSLTWTTGSGGFSGYGQNGNTVENERVIDTNPFGNSTVVWETRASGNGNDDGGWNSDSISIDRTKLYRFSVWVRRTSSTGGGTFYFGTDGGGECPNALGTSSQMCNPYWHCGSPGSLTQNQWYLVVAHIFPTSYTSTNPHPDTGFWTIAGSKVMGINQCNISGGDLKWGASSTSTYHRTYHYYCGDNTTRLQFWNPRMDICDGTQPTINGLLTNELNKLDSTTITVEGASFKHQKVVATGGVITTFNEWRIHRFNSAGTFTISSYMGDSVTVEYLLVGGGGGGGTNMGGGGGGGGVLDGSTVLGSGSYPIGVGGEGAGAPAGTTGVHPTATGSNGGNSTFNGLTAIGGGWGGVSYNTQGLGIHYGNSGGSGGGSAGYNNDNVPPGYYGSGAGTSGQGFRGGYQGNMYYSGGGGGAGAAGVDGNNRPDGGAGKKTIILGRPFYFGGGGGGGSYSLSTGGFGGIGGGGGGALGVAEGGMGGLAWGSYGGGGNPGTWANTPGGNGATNTGGGGGGGAHYNATNKGGDGGSGIVIIRYKYK